MARLGSIIWFCISALFSAFAGYHAFVFPDRFAGVAELFATVVSILIGVSLAVIAVLSSPFSVSEQGTPSPGEAARISKVVKRDDEDLIGGQLFFFATYYLALALLIAFSWVTASPHLDYSSIYIKALSALAAFIGVFAFVWSARLPIMLQKISSQRRTLS